MRHGLKSPNSMTIIGQLFNAFVCVFFILRETHLVFAFFIVFKFIKNLNSADSLSFSHSCHVSTYEPEDKMKYFRMLLPLILYFQVRARGAACWPADHLPWRKREKTKTLFFLLLFFIFSSSFPSNLYRRKNVDVVYKK